MINNRRKKSKKIKLKKQKGKKFLKLGEKNLRKKDIEILFFFKRIEKKKMLTFWSQNV